MNNKFLKEIEKYSYDDLKLIYDTQKDLYSTEEMTEIEAKILEMEKTGKINTTSKQFPKKIICPKCDQPNLFENDVCAFCECKLNKSKYYSDDYIYDPSDEITDNEINNKENNNTSSHAFQYVFSFLIPIIGFILGAILLSKDDDNEKSAGKTCIILGLLSTIISVIIVFIAFK